MTFDDIANRVHAMGAGHFNVAFKVDEDLLKSGDLELFPDDPLEIGYINFEFQDQTIVITLGSEFNNHIKSTGLE